MKKLNQTKEPHPCPNCAEVTVLPTQINYETTATYEGREVHVSVPDFSVRKCGKCGQVFLNSEANWRVTDAVRETLGLLTPRQIKANIDALGMTQREVAARVRVAPESLSRWITGGMIQSAVTDTILRLFFASAKVRDMLRSPNNNLGVSAARQR